MGEINATNFIELSSGYSFRGLEKVTKEKCIYIDTDLPDVVETKRKIASALLSTTDIKGSLQIEPLNALDEEAFHRIVSKLPEGEVVIVNEGLLMYLNEPEKEKLCNLIRSILKERGGYWITADVYLQNKQQKLKLKVDAKTKEFFVQQRIEENRFASFKEARNFFDKMGFEIIKEASIDNAKLSSMTYFKHSLQLKHLFKFLKAGKIQNTWLMKVSKN